ncbi:MAG: TraB/GumN family protein, partial [Ketobacteraceae bacterium]|nr:TraB/GumN family protein [Ketobacteraceae bacterium]
LEPILDHKLQIAFERAGKPVYQLETAQEQVDIFNRLSLADQVSFLRYSLEQQKHFDQYLADMKRHYVNDDLDALQAQATEQMAATDGDYMDGLYQDLIDRRNLRMVDRMRARLHEGNALIAVGALHLTGDYGIIAILRQLNYRVEPVLPSGTAR